MEAVLAVEGTAVEEKAAGLARLHPRLLEVVGAAVPGGVAVSAEVAAEGLHGAVAEQEQEEGQGGRTSQRNRERKPRRPPISSSERPL